MTQWPANNWRRASHLVNSALYAAGVLDGKHKQPRCGKWKMLHAIDGLGSTAKVESMRAVLLSSMKIGDGGQRVCVGIASDEFLHFMVTVG